MDIEYIVEEAGTGNLLVRGTSMEGPPSSSTPISNSANARPSTTPHEKWPKNSVSRLAEGWGASEFPTAALPQPRFPEST